MKNIYLVVAVIVAIVLLIFFFFGRKTEAPVSEVPLSVEKGKLTDGNFVLNTEESILNWEGEFITGAKEQGSVRLKSGNLTINNNSISSGEFVIDMATIMSNPPKDRLVAHLKSDDFFGVASHPTATFTITGFEPTTKEGITLGRYVITGDLTIKGITKPISILSTLVEENGTLIARASFAINRVDWDIKYGSRTFFENLGDMAIRDSVMIGLDLKAQRVIE